MSSRRRSAGRSLPSDPRTETVIKDEDSGIALITEANQTWVEEYERLLNEHQGLKTCMDDLEIKYQHVRKENVKINRSMEISVEMFHKEKDGLVRQNDDLNAQNEKSRKDVREKSGKIGDLQKVLVESQKKANSRKEQLVSKCKQVDRLEVIIAELQNKIIPELKQKLNKSEANLEVVQKRSNQLSKEIDQAEDQHDEDEQTIEKLRQEKNEFIEKLARAERETRVAEEARDKEKEHVFSLQNTEKSLRDKTSQLESDVHVFQSKIRDLENELNRRLAEPEEKSYNITVVESAPSLQSAPVLDFSFGDDGLKNENEMLRTKLAELGERYKGLEKENFDLKAKLDAATKDINKWENKYEDENREKNKMAAQLENEKGNYARLKNEYNDLKSKLAKAERTIEHDKKEMTRKDKIIQELKIKIAQLEQDIEDREGQIAKLEIRLDQLNKDMEKLHENTLEYQTKYGDLDSDYKISEKEKESVQQDLYDVSKKVSELESKLRESEEEKNYLQKEHAELRQKLLRLEDDLDGISKDKTVFENQVQDWSSQSIKHRKVADNIKKKHAQAQEEVEQYKNELAQKNNKIDEFYIRFSELKTQYDTSQTDLSSARADCEYRDDDIKHLKIKIGDKENEISKLEAQLVKATKERDNAEVELAGVLEKLQHMEPKRAGNEEVFKPVEVSYSYSQPQDFESDLAPLRQRIYELENENNRLQKVEDHLQSEIKDDADKIASLQRDLNRANKENEDWERKAASMKNKIDAMEKEEDELMDANTDLRERLHDLTPEVEKLQKKVETLTLERDRLKEYLSDSNSKLTQSKESFNNKHLDFSEQVKVNTTLGKTVKKHEASVESLSQRYKELEEELENLRPELRAALAKNETLEAENKDLDSRTKVQKRQIDDLQKELREEIDAKEFLQQDVDSLSYKLNNAEASNKTLSKQRNDLQSQVDDLENKLRKIKPELDQCRNKLKEKDRIISRLDADVKDKDSQLNAAKRKISTLEETVTSLRKELEAHRSANEINRNRVKELQIQIQEMGNSMQTAVANVSVVHSAPPQSFREERIRSTPDERVHDLETLLKKSESREEQLREQLQLLEGRLPRAEADAKNAHEKVIDIQHNANTLQRKSDDARKMLDRSNREKEDAKKELMKARTELTVLETKSVADANEISSLQSQLDQAHRRLEETQEKLLAIDEEHVHNRLTLDVRDKEKNDLDVRVKRLQEVKKDLEDKVNHGESKINSSQQTCNELREEKAKALKEINELRRTTINDLERKCNRMQGERDRALEDCKMATSQIEDLENQLANSKTKIQELDRDNDDLEAEIRQLKNEIETNRKKTEDLEDKIEVLNLELQRDEKDIDELREIKIRLEDENADLHVKLAEKQDVINIAPMQVTTVDTQYSAAPGFDFGSDPDALRDLEDENTDLKEKLERGEMEYGVLHTERRLKELEKKLPEAVDELNLVSDQFKSAERELELLKDELEDAQTKLGTAEAQQVAGIAKLKTLQQQLEDTHKDLLDRNDDIIEKQRKINELYAILESGDKDSDRLKLVIEELREDVDIKDRENRKLQKDIRFTQENLAKLQAYLEEIEQKLYDTEHQRDEYIMKVDGLEVEIEMQERALKEAQREVDDSREKLRAAKKEIDNLRSQLKEANVSLKATNDEKRILKGRIAELQAIIDQLRTELSAKNTAITPRSGASDAFVEDLSETVSKRKLSIYKPLLKKRRKITRKLREVAEERQFHLVSKDSEIKRLEDKIAKLEEEKEKLRREYANLEKKNSDLKVEYEKLKHEKNRAENELSLLKKKFLALQNQLNTVDVPKQLQDVVSRKKYQDLEGSCQEALRDKERAKSDMAAYRTKMARLEAELNEHKKEKDVSEDEKNRLRNGETDLKTKLQALRDRHKKDNDKNLEWRKNNYAPLEQELQRAKGLIKGLEKTTGKQNQEIEDLKDDLADRDKRIAELEDELENQDITDAGPLDVVNIDIRGDSQALQKAFDEKADAVQEAQKFKSKAWSLEHDVDILKTKETQQEKMVAEVNNMNDKLKDDLRQLKKGTWDQQGSYNKLIKENSELAYQVNTLKEDKEDLEKDVQELRNELNEVRGENRKFMMENKELKLELQQLEVRLHELEMGHRLAKDDNDKIRKDLLQFESENAYLKDNINSASYSYSGERPPMMFDDDVDGIKRDKDKLQIELEASEEQVKMLQIELDDKQTKNDLQLEELTETRRRLREDEANYKKLEAEIENLRHEVDLANHNYEDQRNENRDLLDAKDNLQAEAKELREEVKDLETQLQKLAKEKADLDRELKRFGKAPIERRPSRDLHNEKDKKIRDMAERVVQLERDIQRGGYELSSLREEKDELQVQITNMKDENNYLHSKSSQLELDGKRNDKKIEDLEKENQELKDMLGRNNEAAEKSRPSQARQAELKKQLDEYSYRFDDSSKQLAVQITRFVGDQSETFRKEAQEKDDRIKKLEDEKFELEMHLESQKEEQDAAKSNLIDIQKQYETLQENNKTLREDKYKLDNKLLEEMNINKVKTAELEAEQDILKSKIKDKDDLIRKYEKQVEQLREQLATSVSQRPGIDYFDLGCRQTSKAATAQLDAVLPRGLDEQARSSDTSRSDSEHSQFGELLGKEISHGRRSGKPSEPIDHIDEIVEASSKDTTESESDYASQLRSSTPVSDDDDKKSGRKPSDRDSGSQRYGDRYSTRDRDRESTRDRASDREKRSDRGKDRNRSDCQQN
ncbi:hypothetical protein OS493_028718 [Desmophyllum pertusum]|uniref:Uncharacterized protein n=1 Tax=Desmophyllum pertusum TaxID=174260 RepID=A0A9X0CCX6_9CNID|nr:hypothetical protein OS493_028718 [Desmophyllum pertusum]